MDIRPLKGIGHIDFGMRSSTVKSVTANPIEIHKKGLKFEEDEVWSLNNKSLVLEFDCCFEFRLSKIKIKDKTTLLNNSSIIGESSKELLKRFPSIKLAHNFTHPKNKTNYKEYSHSELGLEFLLKNNIIDELILEPDPSLDFMRYCSRYRKKHFYSKRYINKYLRNKEKQIAVEFTTQIHSLGKLNNVDFIDEWFIGSCLNRNPNYREFWCDGVTIKRFSCTSKNTIYIDAIAEILSSKNDKIFRQCEFTGFIEISKRGNKLKNYRLILNLQDKYILFQKNKKPALSIR